MENRSDDEEDEKIDKLKLKLKKALVNTDREPNSILQ